MGGKSSGGDTTTKTEPWSGQAPYLTDAYQQAQNLYRSGGPEYFPNATYTNFSPQSQMAMQLGENRALYGSQFDQPAGNVAMQGMAGNSPFTQAGAGALGMAGLGAGQLAATSNGAFLNSNPYLDRMFGAAAQQVGQQYNNQVMPGINATFGSGGRTGSNAHQQAMDMANDSFGNTLGNMAANIYGGNYQSERDRQMAASMGLGSLGTGIASGYGSLGQQNFGQQLAGAGLGQQLGQNDWANIGQLGQIGQQVEGKAGQMLGDQQDRFNFYQQRPENQMNNYVSWINGIPSGGGTQTTEGGGGNALTGALGGALTGGALGGMLPASMLGAIPGGGWALAGLGGLLGLMG